MLWIEKYDEKLNCREFTFSGGIEIFHQALRAVKRGESRFHVINSVGDNFDLRYSPNDEEMEHTEGFRRMFLPEYFTMNGLFLEYDENMRERLILDYFDGFERVYFTRLNEYTVVLCSILLSYTDKKIFFKDERIRWFLPDPDITVTQEFPEKPGQDYMIVCGSFLEQRIETGLSKLYDITLFNAVFYLDALTDLETDKIRYVVFYIDKIEGMGALLINYLKAKRIFGRFGFQVYLKEGSSRFSDTLLQKYFKVEAVPDDSDESNTIYIPNYFGAVLSCPFMAMDPTCDIREVLQDDVVRQMEEYRQAVLGNQKVLGLMVSGTDYQKNQITQQPVSMESLISLVKEKLASDGYDRIFLATEDADKLKTLVSAFPGKIVALSQERYSLSDFNDGINLISEMEKKNRTLEDQEALTEDTTINYFYAIYILTKCDGFLATPFTNGVRCVQTFRQDRFPYMEILNDTI